MVAVVRVIWILLSRSNRSSLNWKSKEKNSGSRGVRKVGNLSFWSNNSSHNSSSKWKSHNSSSKWSNLKGGNYKGVLKKDLKNNHNNYYRQDKYVSPSAGKGGT